MSQPTNDTRERACVLLPEIITAARTFGADRAIEQFAATLQAEYERGRREAAEEIAVRFEDLRWARARYNDGIEWHAGLGLGAFSPHKHAVGCAAAIRSEFHLEEKP